MGLRITLTAICFLNSISYIIISKTDDATYVSQNKLMKLSTNCSRFGGVVSEFISISASIIQARRHMLRPYCVNSILADISSRNIHRLQHV